MAIRRLPTQLSRGVLQPRPHVLLTVPVWCIRAEEDADALRRRLDERENELESARKDMDAVRASSRREAREEESAPGEEGDAAELENEVSRWSMIYERMRVCNLYSYSAGKEEPLSRRVKPFVAGLKSSASTAGLIEILITFRQRLPTS